MFIKVECIGLLIMQSAQWRQCDLDVHDGTGLHKLTDGVVTFKVDHESIYIYFVLHKRA